MSENNHIPAPHQVSIEVGGRTLILETGKIAKQANGAVTARYGDTVVLVTACMAAKANDRDFLPLTVDYRENTYSAGKIPGGFFKREGRPTEKEILVSRLIDRPMRPLFPDSLAERNPNYRHGAVRRQRQRSRRHCHDRGFRGGLLLRPAVHRSHRRRARGPAGWKSGGQSDGCRAEDQQAEHCGCRHGKGHRDGGIRGLRGFRREGCGSAGIWPRTDQENRGRHQAAARPNQAHQDRDRAIPVRPSHLRQHEEDLWRQA